MSSAAADPSSGRSPGRRVPSVVVTRHHHQRGGVGRDHQPTQDHPAARSHGGRRYAMLHRMASAGRSRRSRLALVLLVACNGDDGPATTTTTSTTSGRPGDRAGPPACSRPRTCRRGSPRAPTSTTRSPPSAPARMRRRGSRPPAAAIVGFTRTPAGASVIELVFRFEADGAAQLRHPGRGALHELQRRPRRAPVSPSPTSRSAPTVATDAGRRGQPPPAATACRSAAATSPSTSPCCSTATSASLVAVLGLEEEPPRDLDELATHAFTAAIDRLG